MPTSEEIRRYGMFLSNSEENESLLREEEDTTFDDTDDVGSRMVYLRLAIGSALVWLLFYILPLIPSVLSPKRTT